MQFLHSNRRGLAVFQTEFTTFFFFSFFFFWFFCGLGAGRASLSRTAHFLDDQTVLVAGPLEQVVEQVVRDIE